MAGTEVERIGRGDEIFFDYILLVGRCHECRTGHCGTPFGVGLLDQRIDSGHMGARHRGAHDGLKELIRSTQQRCGRITRQDADTRGGDIGFDDLFRHRVGPPGAEGGHHVGDNPRVFLGIPRLTGGETDLDLSGIGDQVILQRLSHMVQHVYGR